MKALIFVAVVVVLWLAIRGIQPQPSTVEASTPRSEGYLEVRASMKFQSASFEMVIVEEKPLLEHCKNPQRANKIVSACPEELNCAVTKVECKSSVDNRYLNMLAAKPAHLHYAHLSQGKAPARRNAVLVVWGMTETDSMFLCQSILSDPELAKDPETDAQCI